ncbi:WD40 repeat domain-containing protein [Frankia sp. AgKG'84/4]|nr:WD40 repeat domain-containing protein [Frankia sp. AgKG'84/4]
MEHESAYWLANGGSLDRFFVVRVAGDVPGDLPPTLRGLWDRDNPHVDFRPRSPTEPALSLDLSDEAFLGGVAAIAGPMLGLEKRQLIVDHRREQARAVRVRRVIITVLVVLTVLALGLAGFATVQRDAAIRQSKIALSQRVAAEARLLAGSDRNLAAQLSLVAWQTAPTEQARDMLLSLDAAGVPTRVFADVANLAEPAVSPDGRLMFAASRRGIVRCWDVTDPRRPRPISTFDPRMGTVTTVRLADGGRTLLLGGLRGVSVWDVSDPRRPRAGAPTPLREYADDLQVASNGVLASTTESGPASPASPGSSRTTVHLWRRHGARVTPVSTLGPAAGKGSVALSEDGQLLAFARPDGAVQMWNIHDLTRPTDAGLLPATVTGGARVVAFDHDHSMLAVAPVAGRPVVFWKLQAGRVSGPPAATFSVTSPAVAMAFAPDDHTVALSLDQGMVVAVDVRSFGYSVLMSDPAGIASVAYRPDGRTLFVALSTGTLQLLPVAARPVPQPLGAVTATAALPGNILVTLRGTTVQSWRITAGVPPEPAESISTQGVAVATEAGTSRLAVARARDIALFHLDRLGRPSPLGRVPQAGATALALTDDQVLVAGGAGRTLYFWDVRSPRQPRLLDRLTPADGVNGVPPRVDGVRSVVASGRSRCGAFLTASGTIWVFGGDDDWRRSAVTTQLDVARSAPSPLAMSSDGRTLATTTGGSSFRLASFSPDCGIARTSLHPARGHSVVAVGFGSDPHTLITADSDHVSRLWALGEGPPKLAASLLGATANPLTVTMTSVGGAAVGFTNGEVVSWEVDAESVFRRRCALVGAPLSAGEWREHVDDRSPRSYC